MEAAALDAGARARHAADAARHAGTGAQPYSTAQEHLLDRLDRLDVLLRRELARGHPRPAPQLLGLAAVAEDEVGSLLDARAQAADPALAHELAAIEQRLKEREACSLAAGMRLPCMELARRFGLSALEVDLLVACLAPEIDRRYERIYGYLQDDLGRKAPSGGLLLAVLVAGRGARIAARAVLNPLAPLRHYRLLEVGEDGAHSPVLSRPLRIDERVAAFLLGDPVVDARVAPCVVSLDAGCGAEGLTRRQQADVRVLVADLVRASQAHERPLVYLHGARRAGADVIVAEIARALELPVLAVDGRLLGASADVDAMLFLLFREALLGQAALFFQDIDGTLEGDGGGVRFAALVRWAVRLGGVVFVSGEHPWRWAPPSAPLALRTLEVRGAGLVEQIELWRVLAGADAAALDLPALVSRHPLQPGAIGAAWRLARAEAAVVRGEGASPTPAELHAACRLQVPTPVSGLARRIEARRGWPDLVLPHAQLEQLRALCGQARHLSTVYGMWGFERKLSSGKGLSALFSGPSGTGKTLAAEVMAADLGVELLAVDLSQVVSKYIGETEKNLRQLFEQAGAARAILFFDEADALLGKRSEVKDARDRYANTEVAYLLQKMEEHEGITVLATNLRQNIDDAFTRRLRFVIEFPHPEEDDRLRIWRSAFPPETPLAPDVDFPRLAARFRLSGGNIRNIALQAAFLAAEGSEVVAMRHLAHAARGELLKMGRLVHEDGGEAGAARRGATP